MYPIYQKVYILVTKIILVSACIVASIGCDSILPSEFKEKNFGAMDKDVMAGNILTRDTLNDAQGFTLSYQYVPIDSFGVPIGLGAGITPVAYRILPVNWSAVDAQTLDSYATPADSTDSQIILVNFNSIVDSLPELHADSLILVHYPANKAVCYAVLKPAQSQDVYIYTSLQYYYSGSSSVTNVSEYVSIELIRSDNSVVNSSSMVPPESVYGSVEKILFVANSTKIVPVINARYAMHLDAGEVYLVRFTLSNPSLIGNPLSKPSSSFNLASIANQFKVVILSQ